MFTTLESTNFSASLLFKHPQGQLEPFSRDKLFVSIFDSLKHRKDATTDASALTDTVINKLGSKIHEAQVDRSAIIGVTTEVLKRFDRAAATVYQAYHPL